MPKLPGLLLLHGVGDSGACFGPFVERLRAHDPAFDDLKVRTPSANGHDGQISRPGHTIARADQIAATLGHAEELAARTGGPLVIGGHSMGSATALAVVAARPDLACALWLEDPPLFGPMGDDASDPDLASDVGTFAAWFATLQSQPLADVIAAARADHPGWDDAEFEPWARAKQAVDLHAFDEPVPWVGKGWARQARAVRCPTVVVCGDPGLGGIVDPQAAAELSALPGWSVHRLRAGHDVRRDAPDQTVTLLAGLIRSVSG